MDKNFSAYPEEQEVLLYDGLEFLVVDFTYKSHGPDRTPIAHIKLYNNSIHKVPKKMRTIKN